MWEIIENWNSAGPRKPIKVKVTDPTEWMRYGKMKHRKYKTLESRLQSFAKYPVSCTIRRQSLAEAGFFYSGITDCVFCYHCGLGLRNWGEKEIPSHMHALFYPFCPVIKDLKEEEFEKHDYMITSTQIITKEEEEEMKLDTSGPEFQCNRFNVLKETIL